MELWKDMQLVYLHQVKFKVIVGEAHRSMHP